MQIPPDLRAVLEALRRVGRPRLVGGCVRDWLLGLKPKDFDIEVPGVTFATLLQVLGPFGSTDVVGKSFGVIKLRLGAAEYDFSLPRRESKTGAGHRGFHVEPEPNLSDAEAAARRDFTVNAIAYDPFTGSLIDPHGGECDLRAGILRHTSPAFAEDPLRVLRGFQLAARFDFSMAPETVTLCKAIKGTGRELPVERIWGEWMKWAEKSKKPSRGLAVLEETEWLDHFPEVAAMRGTPQEPEWHPEGDVFTHTLHCCDALVRLDVWTPAPPTKRRQWLFAVLAHDFGKPSTTVRAERKGQLRWTSPGHEAAGGPLTETFLRRIGAPLDLIPSVVPLVLNHLAHHHGQAGFTDTGVRRLARKLDPATIDDLCVVMRADHDGRPPLHSPESLAQIETLRARAHQLAVENTRPHPVLQGRHLISLGLKPGRSFKEILDVAFEAQLDGAFAGEGGAIEWAKNYLRSSIADLGS